MSVSSAIDAALSLDPALSIRLFEEAAGHSLGMGLLDVLRAEVESRWPEAGTAQKGVWEQVLGGDEPDTVLYNLACALWAVDEYQPALAAFAEAADRGDEDALLPLGEAQLYLAEYSAAEVTLRRVAGSPAANGLKASGLLGNYYFHVLGRYDDAVLLLLSHSRQMDHKYAVDLAEVHLARGEVGDALMVLQEESASGNEQAPILWGNVLSELLHDDRGAEQAYRKGIELGDAHSAYNLAALLAELGRDDESQHWLEHAARHGDARAAERLRGD